MRLKYKVLFVIGLLLMMNACGVMDPKNKGKGLNFFPISQDKQLGLQVVNEISTNRNQYPILDEKKYSEVYNYLNKIRTTLLTSGNVDYKDEFEWKLFIIHDDKTLNAFCTPGGYIYVYTGLMKFLDSEDQLAGVLAHEIGHADMRHSTRQMTQMFGVQLLAEVLLGNNLDLIKQVSASLIGLKFSRNHETEADERSVLYMCKTPYKADGAAGFFEKLQKQSEGGKTPEFLSTHPSPENRIEHFHNLRVTMGCQGKQDFQTDYKNIVAKLPK